MAGIGGIRSNSPDPYLQGVGQGSKLQDEIQPVKPGLQDQEERISNQGLITGAEDIKQSQEISNAEAQQQEDSLAREKKAMQQNAMEKMAEEALKAQMKETQLNGQLDASQTGEIDPAQSNAASGQQDRYYIDYKDPDPQAVPFRRANGELQRRNIADKKWE